MRRSAWLILKVILALALVFALYVFIRQPILQKLLGAQEVALSDVRTSNQIIGILSGKATSSTTLLVFANHAEQRIGGGFVGSVGVLKGGDGKLQVDSIRSIYYYDHRLEGKGIFVASPNYMTLVPAISARDSLLYVDKVEGARTFRDLFARESGVYANNVVIITPKVLELLLNYTGPIYLPDYQLTISKDTILSVLQKEVESGADKQAGKDPKTILGVLANAIITKLPSLKPEQLVALNRDALQLFATRQAYIYSNDTDSMKSLTKWQSGLAQPGEPNTLLVSAANHNATKSSQAIRQRVEAQITIADDGDTYLKLGITRKHTQDYTGKYTDPKTGQQQWLVGDDLSWVQATLPPGSQLLNANGFTVVSTDPFIIGKDMLTRPLTTTHSDLEVKLPQKYGLQDTLRVKQLILSQFGWFGQDYMVTITAPSGYTPNSGDGEKLADGRSVRYTGFQMNDKKFDYVFKRVK